METFCFQALGTKWNIVVDGDFASSVRTVIQTEIASFEERFSRFKDTSEVNAFRQVPEGVYTVSDELALLLGRAKRLRQLTGGRYDPASGVILEHYGYDQEYSFREGVGEIPRVPSWGLMGSQLHLEGPTAFDLGGIGKGYAIDRVATLLEEAGLQHYLIDAGGDMYATSKSDGSAYRVALEWPGRPDTAYGIVELLHQGLAVSDVVTRSFGKRHHIIDAVTRENSRRVIGVAALARTAWDADCGTAALIHWPEVKREQIEEELGVESVIITVEEEFLVSTGWPGEMFQIS